MAETFEFGFKFDVTENGTEQVSKDVKDVTTNLAEAGESFKRLSSMLDQIKSKSSDAFPALSDTFKKVKDFAENVPDITKIFAFGDLSTTFEHQFKDAVATTKSEDEALKQLENTLDTTVFGVKKYAEEIKNLSSIFKVFSDNEKLSIESNTVALTKKLDVEKQNLEVAKEAYNAKLKEYAQEQAMIAELKSKGSDANGLYTVMGKSYSSDDLKKHLDTYKENIAELKEKYQGIEKAIENTTKKLEYQYPTRLKIMEQVKQ